MTTQRGGGGGGQDPMQAGAQMWEAGYRSLMDGWRQAQEFWTTAARSWGEVAGAWMGQYGRTAEGTTGDSMAVMRELQEAAFAVAQAWMRLPLVLAGGTQSNELQEAVTRLTEAQGRAYQLWIEAFGRAGGATLDAAGGAARATEQAAERASGRAGEERRR